MPRQVTGVSVSVRAPTSRPLNEATTSDRTVQPDPFDAEAGAQARRVATVAKATIGIVVPAMAAVALLQPEHALPATATAVGVAGVCLSSLLLNRTGRTLLAGLTLVAGLMAVVLLDAPTTGGIRSPGVQALIVIAVLAGVVLDFKAGVLATVAFALGSLSLVVLELNDDLPMQRPPYHVTTLWVLAMFYVSIGLVVLRLATSSVADALRQAQRALGQQRTAERRLQQALDTGGIGTYELDLQTNDVIADSGALRLTGLTPAANGRVPGDEWTSRVHPDDWPDLAAEIQRFRQGAVQARTNYRYHHPDGTLRILDVAAYLESDEEGQPASIVGVVIDVTQRELEAEHRDRLSAELRERVKELRTLDEVSQLLQTARTVDANVLADVVRLLPAGFLHEDDAEARIVFGATEVTTPGWTETPWTLSMPFQCTDSIGRAEVCYRSEHPSQDNGVEGQLRQAQRLDALGRLAGGIAHDFNNILGAIGGNAELVAQDVEPGSAAADGLQEILAASARARELVKRIMLFSRDSESHRTVVDVATLADEAVNLLSVSLPEHISIALTVDPGVPSVFADASQLHQVLLNLGTNAIYAMRDSGGTLELHISTAQLDEPSFGLPSGRYLHLAVRDTGTGIPPEARDRIFEPFFTTKGEAGNGLGLAIVHGIVRSHGGTVKVRSVVGEGTEFQVFLPGSTETPTPRDGERGIVRGRGQLLLLVDDEPALVGVLSRALKWMGYSCVEFTSAVAALNAFREDPTRFHGIVTDRSMPEMDGLDLVRRLRAIRPDLPVTVTSGHGAREGYAGDLDPIAWLDKPATLHEISRCLQEMLSEPPSHQ